MITGRAILDLKNYIHENCDVDRIYENCTLKETKEVKDKAVLVSQWYDVEIYNDMLQALNKVCPGKLKDAGSYIAHNQVKGYFGFVSRFFTFEKLINSAGKIFKRYYSDGDFQITTSDKNTVHVIMSGIKFSPELRDLTMYYQKEVGQIATGKKVHASIKNEKPESIEFIYKIEG